jgi:hypothetical protein
MIGYWSSFARTGHPQAANEPDWPVVRIDGLLHGIRRKLHSRQIISCQGCTSSMKKLFAGAERAGTSPGIGMSGCIRPNSRLSSRNVNGNGRIPMSVNAWGDPGG